MTNPASNPIRAMYFAFNVFFASLLVLAPALANTSTKRDNIIKIAEVTGMKDWFFNQAQRRKERLEQGAKYLISAALSSQPDMSNAKKIEVENVLQEYVTWSSGNSSPEYLRDKWLQKFGANLTDSEVEEVLKLYESPLGQKLIRATSFATDELTRINTEGDVERLAAIKRLTEKLASIFAKESGK